MSSHNGIVHLVDAFSCVFYFEAVKGRRRSSAPRLPPINAARMRAAKALVEKAVTVTTTLRRIFCRLAVCSDVLCVTVLAEEGLHGGRTLSRNPSGVEGQGLGGTPFVIHCRESLSLP